MMLEIESIQTNKVSIENVDEDLFTVDLFDAEGLVAKTEPLTTDEYKALVAKLYKQPETEETTAE